MILQRTGHAACLSAGSRSSHRTLCSRQLSVLPGVFLSRSESVRIRCSFFRFSIQVIVLRPVLLETRAILLLAPDDLCRVDPRYVYMARCCPGLRRKG